MRGSTTAELTLRVAPVPQSTRLGPEVYRLTYAMDILENSPEEITALAVEMDQRIDGTWQTTEEDEELQRRFCSFFTPTVYNEVTKVASGAIATRFGAEYLRQHRNLLG